MGPEDIWKVAAAILTALGGGGIIVLALSGWLGKVWAERLMAKERRMHEQELAELRAKLERMNEESLSKLRADLEIYRDTHLKQHNDKIGTYGFVFGVIADFLADTPICPGQPAEIGEHRSGHADGYPMRFECQV